MKKKVGIIILVISAILVVLIGSRIYHFIVIKNIYNAIENFRNESNRYYLVTITNYDQTAKVEEMLVKDNIVKWIEQKSGVPVYCEWKDFNNDQEYSIILQNKTFSENDSLTTQQNFLKNLPKFILRIYQNRKFNMKEFLKVGYIMPVEYNNQKCYKIVTNSQTLIVSRDTYLPIYYSLDLINSQENKKTLTETTYEFKVGEVTDEDISLPDLTGYTKINEQE